MKKNKKDQHWARGFNLLELGVGSVQAREPYARGPLQPIIGMGVHGRFKNDDKQKQVGPMYMRPIIKAHQLNWI